MGKASSSKKVARAAQAAGRPGAKQSYVWPVAIGAVVVVGVLLIVLSLGGTTNAAPRIGDHWHAAYGIYDCDTFLPPEVDIKQDASGIHTHGDGLMHMHPYSSVYTGDGADILSFAEQTGLEVSDDSFATATVSRKTGDKCGTKAGHVELVTWDSPEDTSPKVIRKDIADYAPKNASVWVLAFVADGTEVPLPESARNLEDPRAAEEGRQPVFGGTTIPGTPTTAPGETTTTIAADPATTSTTAAATP